MPQPFIPDTRSYPDDFLRWVPSLQRFRRFRAHHFPRCDWVFTFDTKVPMSGHRGRQTHFSTFSLSAPAVLDSVDWRRLVAAHIRQVRFAARRKAYAALDTEKKAPPLPWPR